jgi:hypothetical protein
MQYSASIPVCMEFHFSALRHGDYDYVLWAELCVVVCWCAKQRVRKKIAGSRRVLATAVDDWSGKPYFVSS